eukprot:CAMPEP_0119131884 /NCGR_PEP_ID=MMETSP1310-20130426/10830_1 /TAXON_ID=464262 /ORGANISM="Genus nov. species nov., Strain RCC2339" /LENGTH=332 /DNA_ID=CAMNT_0007122481 /DNA_START=30 /DNA_END=1028 /DNA_ORIENTATION=+
MAEVIVVEKEKSGAPPPAIKAKLEKEAMLAKPDAEELRTCLDKDMKEHERRRQAALDERASRAHEEVEHAKKISREHREKIAKSVKELRMALQEKSAWVEASYKAILATKKIQAGSHVEWAKDVKERKETKDLLDTENLREHLEWHQKVAEQNRHALLMFKRTLAECEVEHAKEVHDKLERDQEYATTMMDISQKEHQRLATMLRGYLLQYKAAAAADEVEKAQEKHDAQADADKFKQEHAKYKSEQREISADVSRECQLNEKRLAAHEEVEHAKEVSRDVHETRGESLEQVDLEFAEAIGNLKKRDGNLTDYFNVHLKEFLDMEEDPNIRD